MTASGCFDSAGDCANIRGSTLTTARATDPVAAMMANAIALRFDFVVDDLFALGSADFAVVIGSFVIEA